MWTRLGCHCRLGVTQCFAGLLLRIMLDLTETHAGILVVNLEKA